MSINTLALRAVNPVNATPTLPPKDDNLTALTKYIPVESITLYIATLSSLTALNIVLGNISGGRIPEITTGQVYVAFIFISAILMLLIFERRLVLASQPTKWSVSEWPWWKIVACAIAFAVWGLAVPGTLNIDGEDGKFVGVGVGLLALIVSTVLNTLETFFEK